MALKQIMYPLVPIQMAGPVKYQWNPYRAVIEPVMFKKYPVFRHAFAMIGNDNYQGSLS
jgi:hypothetical protein